MKIPMTPLSDVDRVLHAMRAQTVGPVKDAKSIAVKSATSNTGTETSDRWRLADDVIVGISAVDTDDPNRRRRVFRIFLEGKMKALFGRDALGDPAFQSLLDQVHRAMEQDDALAYGVERTTDLLLTALTAKGKHLDEMRVMLNDVLVSGTLAGASLRNATGR